MLKQKYIILDKNSIFKCTNFQLYLFITDYKGLDFTTFLILQFKKLK